MTPQLPQRPGVRPGYQSIGLYTSEPGGLRLDLSDNVNLWGAPPVATTAIARLAASRHANYPTPYGDALKRAVAQYLNVSPDMVVTGCGSDDVLDSAVRAFGPPGSRLAYLSPTFSMVPMLAWSNGLDPLPVPMTPGLDADAAGLLSTRAPVTYLCSPNNPTGGALRRATIERIVAEATGLVIVDEAYAEFAEGDCRELLRREGPLLITRTLSKAFGLAGLRIGYGVAAPEVVHEIEKARGPFKLSAVAEAAAVAALTEGRGWVEARVREAITNRGRLRDLLDPLPGLGVMPSDANFLLITLNADWPDATAVTRALARRGVGVRAFPGLPGIGEAIRVTIGPWKMMEEFCTALGKEAP